MAITLNLVDHDGVAFELPEGAELTLLSAGERLARGRRDESGTFHFDVDPGRVDLAVRLDLAPAGAADEEPAAAEAAVGS